MSDKATETFGSNLEAGALAILQPVLAEDAETFTPRDMCAASAIGLAVGAVAGRMIGDSIPLLNRLSKD